MTTKFVPVVVLFATFFVLDPRRCWAFGFVRCISADRPTDNVRSRWKKRYEHSHRLQRKVNLYQDASDNEYRIPLDLEMERQLQRRREPPIATLTWFALEDHETSQTAVQFLQERANQIVLANPWLQSGRIERRGVEGDSDLVFTTLLQAPPKLEIATTTDAQRLVQNGNDCPVNGPVYQVTLSYTTLDERKGPLWRITVVPAYGCFGLILSVSHLVADIHVYYKLYDMLTSLDQDIGTLDLGVPLVEESDGTLSSSDELAQFHVGGPRVWNLIHSPWLLVKGALGIVERTIWRPLADGPFKIYKQYDDLGNLVSTFRRKQPQRGVEYWFEVDEEELLQIKRLLILEKEEEESTFRYTIDWDELDGRDQWGEKDGTPPLISADTTQSQTAIRDPYYVSTNDVLSAWFFQMTRCRMGLICCNYRGKLKGHHEYLGRNYWGTYALASDQYASPFDIREQILRPMASVEHFPKLAAQLLWPEPLAVISSWTVSSTAVPFFPTLEHWPLYDFASYCPANFVVMRTWWIQRPQKNKSGRVGVYVAGDPNCLVEPMEFWGSKPSFLSLL